MTFREILTAAIAEAKVRGEYPAKIVVPVDPVGVVNVLLPLIRKVNDRPLCGVDTGTLRLDGGNRTRTYTSPATIDAKGTVEEQAEVTFSLSDHSWNWFSVPDGCFVAKGIGSCGGGMYRPVIDSNGNPPYESADFSPLLGPEPEAKIETWRDRKPLLW